MASRNKEGKSLFFSNVDKPKRRFRDAFKKAIEKGKKTFKGDFSKSVPGGPGQKTAGKLEFSTMTKEEVAKKIKKAKESSGRRPNDSRPKAVYEKATGTKVSSRGQAFAKALEKKEEILLRLKVKDIAQDLKVKKDQQHQKYQNKLLEMAEELDINVVVV